MNGTMNVLSAEALSDLFGGATKEEPKELETLEVGDSLFGEESTEQNQEEQEEDNVDENVEDTNTQVEETEENEEEEDFSTENLSDLAKLSLSLLKSGEWADFTIEYEGKNYDSLDDFIKKVDVDAEIFQTLLQQQTTHKISEVESNSVRIDNLDETRANIVKAIALGVDAQSLLNINDELIEPMMRLDLSNPNDAIQVVALELQNQGYDNEYIEFKVNKLMKEGDLTYEAERLREKYITEFNSAMAEKQEEVKRLEQEKIEAEKQAKREFRKELKAKEYTDTFVKKASDLLYSKTDGVDNWVLQAQVMMQENPDFKADLVHFLLNPEDFLNKKTANIRREEKIKTMINLDMVKSANKSKDGGFAPEKSKKTDIFNGGITFNKLK